jgi:amino acid transporter
MPQLVRCEGEVALDTNTIRALAHLLDRLKGPSLAAVLLLSGVPLEALRLLNTLAAASPWHFWAVFFGLGATILLLTGVFRRLASEVDKKTRQVQALEERVAQLSEELRDPQKRLPLRRENDR